MPRTTRAHGDVAGIAVHTEIERESVVARRAETLRFLVRELRIELEDGTAAAVAVVCAATVGRAV